MVKVNCVQCGIKVSEWTTQCPNCGRPVANKDAPILADLRFSPTRGSQYRKKKSLLFTISGLLIIIGISSIIYFLKLL